MRTRITIELELDDTLLDQLRHSAVRTTSTPPTGKSLGYTIADLIEKRLAATIEYDLTGTPLFLDDDDHRRLREISGSSMVSPTEALLDRLAHTQQLSLDDGEPPLTLKANILERVASRAKVFQKTPGALAREYALAGIKERVGL